MRTVTARVLFVLITLLSIGGAIYGGTTSLAVPIAVAIGIVGTIVAACVALVITPTD